MKEVENLRRLAFGRSAELFASDEGTVLKLFRAGVPRQVAVARLVERIPEERDALWARIARLRS